MDLIFIEVAFRRSLPRILQALGGGVEQVEEWRPCNDGSKPPGSWLSALIEHRKGIN